MIRILTAVLLASCVTAARAEAQEQPFQFETAGLSTFWKVFDRLRADQEPTDAEWAELWAAPGYAVLEARERRRASLTRAFRLAFRPSLADSLALELGRPAGCRGRSATPPKSRPTATASPGSWPR